MHYFPGLFRSPGRAGLIPFPKGNPALILTIEIHNIDMIPASPIGAESDISPIGRPAWILIIPPIPRKHICGTSAWINGTDIETIAPIHGRISNLVQFRP